MTASNQEMAATLRENIARLTARQRDEARQGPRSERVAGRITAFTGSMAFVALHVVVFGLWIAINLGAVPVIARFDPSFVMLAMVASVEAIFLSTFVLISQNRMAAAADRRADLDLHVNLLAEHELTRLAGLVQRIAEKLDITVDDSQFEEIRKDIQPTQVLDALDERRREEGLEH
ncbi:DUF1003 domain-containing protein [Novosphingobium resinovorum]|uniref:DUF1003 domain-containing protein n=1 Tax=Novosphingobium TaxID=165696 RepID=UPI001B3C997C|nr:MULTISPECIES: DUF1003 domain-containing protein [Novosphingobium]MBF7013827.1 DUF1003 domain-containing protein [Novosphingobium sp. HR1a]WJM25971.1 DUF1003 domain-containing protein [Novosphingobium resinovorum]